MQEIIAWFCIGRKDCKNHYCYYFLILIVRVRREVFLGDYFLFGFFLLVFFVRHLLCYCWQNHRDSLKTHGVKSWPR